MEVANLRGLTGHSQRALCVLLVRGRPHSGVGTLVLLPSVGSSRSYKLHSSLRPGTGLPGPRAIRDRPDCTSVAAHRKAENPVSCQV